MPRGQMMAHGAIYQAEATPWQKKKKKKGLSLGSTPPPPSPGEQLSLVHEDLVLMKKKTCRTRSKVSNPGSMTSYDLG